MRKDVAKLEQYKESILLKVFKINEPRGTLEKKVFVEEGIIKIAKYNKNEHDVQDLIEYLMSILLKKINVNSMNVELGYEVLDDKIIKCCLVHDVVNKKLGNESVSLEGAFLKSPLLSYSMSMEDSINAIYKVIDKIVRNRDELEAINIAYLNMLLCDYVFSNADRHLENFFLIYNSFNKSYSFGALIDNGECFGSYKDNFNKCHLGFCQYRKEEYINFLISNYKSELEPLIGTLNNNLTKDYLIEVLSMDEFYGLDERLKTYILNEVLNNINSINNLCKTKKM